MIALVVRMKKTRLESNDKIMWWKLGRRRREVKYFRMFLKSSVFTNPKHSLVELYKKKPSESEKTKWWKRSEKDKTRVSEIIKAANCENVSIPPSLLFYADFLYCRSTMTVSLSSIATWCHYTQLSDDSEVFINSNWNNRDFESDQDKSEI